MSSWAVEYFGNEVLTKSGTVPTLEAIANKKRVGIYFSAHWCPPCRGFTPVLAEFFEQLENDDPNQLQIIFVSSDRDENSFNSYYEEMPWAALPYSNSSAKQKLSQRFGVSGIPTFIVLDAENGSVKDANARTTVTSSNGNTSKAIAAWA